MRILLLLISTLVSLSICAQIKRKFDTLKAEELRDLQRAITSKLNSNASIPKNNEPRLVNLYIHLRRVDEIDVERGTVELGLDIHQEWNEPQLRGKASALDDKSWNIPLQIVPFVKIFQSLVTFDVSPEGKVLKNMTKSVTARCLNSQGEFPSDTVNCTLVISAQEKMAYLRWKDGMKVQTGSRDTIVASPFEIESVELRSDKTKHEEATHLIYEIILQRHAATYYWFSSVQPVLFFLILTWTSLFLNREKFITHRIFIALVSLVVVLALSVGTNSAGGRAERGNVLDVWFRFSSLLIFVLLLENIIIAILSTRKHEESHQELFYTKPKRASSEVEKLPKAMNYLTKVFYPIIAFLVLFYVFIKI